MKNSLLILLVLISAVCWGQDTAMQTFKIHKANISAEAEIDGQTGGGIYWKELISAGKIEITGCTDCKIKSFDLQITASKDFESDSSNINPKLSGSFHSDSAVFSKQMIRAIRKVKQGTVKFYNIVVVNSLGQSKTSIGIELEVTPKKIVQRYCSRGGTPAKKKKKFLLF